MTDDNFYVKKVPQSIYRKRHGVEDSEKRKINYELKKLNIKDTTVKSELRENVSNLYRDVCKALFSEDKMSYINEANLLDKIMKKLNL
ncbi:hypothetical protein HOH45_00155 [bacterium]|jgi:hypothetical protein|nr:hypothetical protein [bacterium]